MIDFLNSAQDNEKETLMLVITAPQQLLKGHHTLTFIKPAIKFSAAKVRTFSHSLLYSTSYMRPRLALLAPSSLNLAPFTLTTASQVAASEWKILKQEVHSKRFTAYREVNVRLTSGVSVTFVVEPFVTVGFVLSETMRMCEKKLLSRSEDDDLVALVKDEELETGVQLKPLGLDWEVCECLPTTAWCVPAW